MLAVLAASSAFVQPATLNVARAASLTTLSEPTMGFFDNLQPKRSGAVGGAVKKQAGPKVSPLSPGSNYPGTKNLQEQSYGFGAFRQKFQTRDGKSAYGVPIFDKKGNVNPAYLAKERAEMAKKSKNNVKNLAKRRNEMISKGTYLQSSYVEKKIGNGAPPPHRISIATLGATLRTATARSPVRAAPPRSWLGQGLLPVGPLDCGPRLPYSSLWIHLSRPHRSIRRRARAPPTARDRRRSRGTRRGPAA